MKIVEVQVWKQNLKLRQPYSIANHYFDSAENLFVKVILENGIIGIGSGSPSKYVCNEWIDESWQLLQNCLDDLLINQSILNFHALLSLSGHRIKNHPAALAAVDIALHDAFCKLQNIRIVDFYGVQEHRLPTSITLTIMSLEESKKEVQRFLKLGFKVVKVKIGEDVIKDIDLCRSIQSWSNGKMRIRVDGNQGYNSADLNTFLQAARELEVEFIEQPLVRDALSEMRLLSEEIRQYCMADEDLHGPKDALKLLAGTVLPFGLFNIKLMKCGGIARGKQIAQMAALKNVNLMWGCMDESVVSISAALHLAYSCPNTRYLDLDGHLDIAEDIVQAGFKIDDGHMLLNERPGLGVN